MWSRLYLAVLLAVTSPTLAAPFAYTGTNVGDGGAEGLKLLFAEHGRNAEDITAALVGGELPLNGVKVLIIGSYANTGPALATLRARRDGLEKWVAAGGVLLELVQQDGGYPRSDWLPDGMLVSRADPDFDSVTWRRPDHPLATTPNRLDAAAMSGWQLKRWGIAWEALTSWDGFENILACGPRGERSALVEGSYGRGRVMVSVVSPDSMVTHGEGETPAKARLYFANLLHYLDELVAGRGVRLNPTPALGPVRGATTGRLRIALLAPPESLLAGQLARVGVAPSRVGMMVPTPATADVLLIDAGAAEELSAAAAAQVAAFAHAGGVVVELSQNQQQRPAWLPIDQRVRRGGFPADLLVPAVAEHPLFNSPNALVGARRSAWREGEQPLARPPFDATLGWGVVARFGGEQAPAAVVER
ncbi:MAG: hypothetical protein HUU35_14155, partial [Armatimonadetes bacterium]|nr:hypothetical protein [Armatimonadota bacterium]